MSALVTDHLIPLIRARFPQARIEAGGLDRPFAIFPAAHPEVGTVELYEDGEEIVAMVGRFTHAHFFNEGGAADAQWRERVAEDVVKFLEELFADRIELFGSPRSGGWRPRGARRGFVSRLLFGKASYVWSGPLAEP